MDHISQRKLLAFDGDKEAIANRALKRLSAAQNVLKAIKKHGHPGYLCK